MDPTTTLCDVRALVNLMLGRHEPLDLDAAKLCEKVAALDDWLKRGGHLPNQWRPSRQFAGDPQTVATLTPSSTVAR